MVLVAIISMLKFNTIDTCSGGFGFQKQEIEKKI